MLDAHRIWQAIMKMTESNIQLCTEVEKDQVQSSTVYVMPAVAFAVLAAVLLLWLVAAMACLRV